MRRQRGARSRQTDSPPYAQPTGAAAAAGRLRGTGKGNRGEKKGNRDERRTGAKLWQEAAVPEGERRRRSR